MALLKLSGIVSAISGKFGGSIFANGSQGNYVKNNAYSQQPRTPAQTVQQNKIYLTTQQWRLLTPTQKTLWNNEVVNYPYVNRVGDVVYYNGYQLYNLLNSNRLLIDEAQLSSPAAVKIIGTPIYSISNANTLGVVIGVLNNVLGDKNLVYATRGLPPNQLPHQKDFRLITYGGGIGGNYTFPITAPYLSLFPPLEVVQRVYCKFKTVVSSTGEPSAIEQQTSFLVVS